MVHAVQKVTTITFKAHGITIQNWRPTGRGVHNTSVVVHPQTLVSLEVSNAHNILCCQNTASSLDTCGYVGACTPLWVDHIHLKRSSVLPGNCIAAFIAPASALRVAVAPFPVVVHMRCGGVVGLTVRRAKFWGSAIIVGILVVQQGHRAMALIASIEPTF